MFKLSQIRYLVIIDLFLLVASELLVILSYSKGTFFVDVLGWEGIVAFSLLWMCISFACRKYRIDKPFPWQFRLVLCNGLMLVFSVLSYYLYKGVLGFPNDMYLFFFLITGLELFFFKGIELVSNVTDVSKAENFFIRRRVKQNAGGEAVRKIDIPLRALDIVEIIKEERGVAVAEYISSIGSIGGERACLLVSQDISPLDLFSDGAAKSVINIRRLNNKQHLNAFLQTVNKKLEDGGHLLCCVEIKSTRKQRILSQYPIGINCLAYGVNYIFKCVFPKLPLTRGFYFFITKGYNRCLTYTETLGRLYACGFELKNQKQIGDLYYLKLQKVAEVDRFIAKNYGLLIKLPRIGKDGKLINVYKMRTMHPYAEYLQSYLYENKGVDAREKLKDDFRVHFAGSFLRSIWFDEFPNLINLFKGDIKLFGVRPLSQHRFDTYPKALQEKRLTIFLFRQGLYNH